jgi:hypothetical protein
MRLKIKNLNRLINENLTDSEISLYIYLTQRADLKGILTNLKMREAKKVCDFSKQTFYNALRSLAKKNFLVIQKNKHIDYDIYIIDNQFEDEKDASDPYMNLHYDFLNSKDFHNLNKNIKLLLLRLFSMKNKTIKMTKDTLKKYKCLYALEFLEKYLNITQKVNGTYILKLKRGYKTTKHNIFYNSYKHKVKNIINSIGLRYFKKQLKDTIKLSINFREYFNHFRYALEEMKRYDLIQPKVINTIIQTRIKRGYSL